MPPLDPDVADLAPSDPALTSYDQQHAITYLRLLDRAFRTAGLIRGIGPSTIAKVFGTAVSDPQKSCAVRSLG